MGRYPTADSPRWAGVGGWRTTTLYSRSLGLLMLGLFLFSWMAQAVAGHSAYGRAPQYRRFHRFGAGMPGRTMRVPGDHDPQS